MRPTLSLRLPLAKVKPSSRPSLTLHSFLTRESPSSLSNTSSSNPIPTAFSSPLNPFQPTKDLNAKSWIAPKYSLRRQKILRKELAERGWPSEILPTPIVRAEKASEEAVKDTKIMRSTPFLPKSRVLDALTLEAKGPYAGRKIVFKGKVWERRFGARQEELRVALSGADAKAKAWKKAKAEERAKAKSKLPF